MLGAGIAGLQAIGTLKRLGAVVTAYDVRPASQGEVESLGAKFLDLGLDFSKGQGEGGYARALSAEEQAQQQLPSTKRPPALTSSSPPPRSRAVSPRCCSPQPASRVSSVVP